MGRTKSANVQCWLVVTVFWLALSVAYSGRGGIAKTGMLYFYSPLVTIGLAVIFFGQTMTPPVLGVAAPIFAGVYISQRK